MRFVSSNASPTIIVTFGLPAIQPTFTPLATSRVFCPTPSQAEIFHTESRRFFPEELLLLSLDKTETEQSAAAGGLLTTETGSVPAVRPGLDRSQTGSATSPGSADDGNRIGRFCSC